MKIRTLATLGLLTAILGTGVAAPSYAATTTASTELRSNGTGAPSSARDVPLSDLLAQSAAQDAQDIAEVVASASAANPVTVLLSSDGEQLAAIATPRPAFSTMAISPIGPACTATSACIYPNYGYVGTGVLSINVASNKVFAGDRATTVWVGPQLYLAQPYITTTWALPKRFDTIVRT